MEKKETPEENIKLNLSKLLSCIENNCCFLFYFSPDPDAIGASLAMSLYLRSINKKSAMLIPDGMDKNLNFLNEIAIYNGIDILTSKDTLFNFLLNKPIIIIPDTPTHYLLPYFDELSDYFSIVENKENVIEVDHHFKGDSEQIFTESLTFFINCNSVCEIIAEFLSYISCENLKSIDYDVYFPRNIILSLLVGICFDTQFGKFIHNQEVFDKWFTPLSNRLTKITWNNELYLSSSRHIFDTINQMSEEKNKVLNQLSSKTFIYNKTGLLLMPYTEKYKSLSDRGDSTCVFSKLITDISNIIPELSGYVGIFAYFDTISLNYFIKIRRSQVYSGYDLRNIEDLLKECFGNDFLGGGGHEGAVSFRISAIERYDFTVKINHLHKKISKLIGST